MLQKVKKKLGGKVKKGLLKVILTAILCFVFISCGAKKEEVKTNNGERGHLKVALY